MNTHKDTVLIADDEPYILRVAALKLDEAGFDVVKAHNGQSAWDTLQERDVSLVITDYQMPQVSGLELAMMMADDTRLSATPIILLTGKSFSITAEDSIGTNIVKVFSKPFSPKQLVKLARSTIDTFQGVTDNVG